MNSRGNNPFFNKPIMGQRPMAPNGYYPQEQVPPMNQMAQPQQMMSTAAGFSNALQQFSADPVGNLANCPNAFNVQQARTPEEALDMMLQSGQVSQQQVQMASRIWNMAKARLYGN